MSGSEMSGVGFGRASLWGTWKTDKVPADEVEVRVLAARQGPAVAVMAVADVMELWPSSCRRLRQRLSRELAVPMESIGIFATQNHGVEGDGPPDVDHEGVDRAFVAAAKQALDSVQPAEVAIVAVRPDPPLNVCRRLHYNDFGAFSFWFGYHLDAQGRADVSHILKLALSQMAEGKRLYPVRLFHLAGRRPEDFVVPDAPLPVQTPLYLGPSADVLVQGLFFRGAGGKPLGSVLRFCAHPNAANRGGVDWASGDYPVYARRRLEEAFGGTSVFFTGPCGDSCALIDRKGLDLAEKIGRQVADVTLKALPSAGWRPAEPVKAFSPPVELRVRPDFPASREQARDTCAILEEQIRAAVSAGRPLVEIKRLLDQWEMPFYTAQGAIMRWTGLDPSGKAGMTFSHPLYVARIGPAVIAGLPGEPFSGVGLRLRRETLGDRLLVVEAANGYLSYIPTAEEYPLGGYGPSAAIFDETAEERLVKTMRAAMEAEGWHFEGPPR